MSMDVRALFRAAVTTGVKGEERSKESVVDGMHDSIPPRSPPALLAQESDGATRSPLAGALFVSVPKRKEANGVLNDVEKDRGRSTRMNPSGKRLKPDGHTRATTGQSVLQTDGQEIDEWSRFQEEVLKASSNGTAEERRPYLSAYPGATTEAQPIIRSPGEKFSGGYETREGEDEVEEAVEQRKESVEREAQEEVLARIVEERRVQEDAAIRVQALKSRLARIRSARSSRDQETKG